MKNTDQNIKIEDLKLINENIFFEDINEWDKYCDNIEGV